jgi:hypothetical protein
VLNIPVMTHQPAAPSEADAPRPWARAILHARIPAPLKLLLLALLAAFSMAEAPRRTLRALRQDWLFSTSTDFAADLESVHSPDALRRILQLRAEIGWLLRGTPNRGMSLSGHRAPVPCAAQPARAPPWAANAPRHPESVAKTPRPAATTHARAPAQAAPKGQAPVRCSQLHGARGLPQPAPALSQAFC